MFLQSAISLSIVGLHELTARTERGRYSLQALVRKIHVLGLYITIFRGGSKILERGGGGGLGQGAVLLFFFYNILQWLKKLFLFSNT